MASCVVSIRNVHVVTCTERFEDSGNGLLSCGFITALHEMQTRSSDENSVCPSVCLSVTGVDCDKTVERSVQIYIQYERTFSLVF